MLELDLVITSNIACTLTPLPSIDRVSSEFADVKTRCVRPMDNERIRQDNVPI